MRPRPRPLAGGGGALARFCAKDSPAGRCWSAKPLDRATEIAPAAGEAAGTD